MSDEVTLGVLGEKMDAMQLLLREHIALDRVGHKNHDERIRVTETRIAVIDQQLKHSTRIMGVLQAGVIAVVTWLGVRE